MSSKATYKCKCCGKPFEARKVDRARGWARFCSKSCKAIKQTQRTGYAGPSNHDDRMDRYDDHPFSSDGLGQWI
jgi:hypothetical protein